MTRKITVKSLACGKFQVHSDSGLNHGHFDSFLKARMMANEIAANIKASTGKYAIIIAE